MTTVDWLGVIHPWVGVNVDLEALQKIVSQVMHVPSTKCGPPVVIGDMNYGRVYSFQLPLRTVVARLVAPVKPLFKTENEVAAMDFVRSTRHYVSLSQRLFLMNDIGRTSLPIPTVFAYCSEANNPVGAEWLIMEHMPGVEMGDAWDELQLPQKRRLALDLVDLYDQLSRLKASGCGGIYHSIKSVDDSNLLTKRSADFSEIVRLRSPRWVPLSQGSLHMLRSHCDHSTNNCFELGPIHNISLLNYLVNIPSPSRTLPVFTSDEYVKLIAFNGNPTTRSDHDLPSREKCVELFQAIHNLYSNSTFFGPAGDALNFRFSHGDLHEGNILIDPKSGAITGVIDWEAAGFRPLWTNIRGVGWFEEDRQRFIFGSDEPGNFDEEGDPEDLELRAFFRTELHRRNPDLFTSFLGAIELRAVVQAAADDPRPVGETDIFLTRYHKLGYWKEQRRGPFPWNMNAWLNRRMDLDEKEMARRRNLCGLDL